MLGVQDTENCRGNAITMNLANALFLHLRLLNLWMPWKWYTGGGGIIPQPCRSVQIATGTQQDTSSNTVRIVAQLWRIDTMTDNEKLIQLFSRLTVFATPGMAATYFQRNHVVIQKYGHWKPTGDHFLPYQCSACESNEEGRTNYCPNCGARMDGDGNGT